MTLSRMVARPLLATTFVVGGVHAFRNTSTLAVKAKPVADRLVPAAQKVAPKAPVPTDPETLVRVNAGVQVAAGLALATGRAPRLSAAALAATMVPSTLGGHRFWELDDPTERSQQKMLFFKNISLLGGLLIASRDTEGRPGMAWRARHAANDARREARHLAATARREARLAKAHVT